MKKFFILVLLCFFMIFNVNASSLSNNVVLYEEELEDFEGISLANDEGYVVVGSKSNKAIFIKYNNGNEIVWQKSFGGSGVEYLYDVEITANGYVAVGYCSSTDMSSVTNNGNKDAYIIKIDFNGNLLWMKNYGGSSDDVFYDIEVLKDGSYIAVGYSLSKDLIGVTTSSQEDGLIVKYDSNGNLKYVNVLAGDSSDIYRGLSATSDGGYVVVGSTLSSDIGFTQGNVGDGILFKYSSDGNIVWKQKAGLSSEAIYGSIYGISFAKDKTLGLYDVIEISDGSFITVGKLEGNQAEFTPGTYAANQAMLYPAILKYDKNGIYKWGDSLDDSGGALYDVVESSNGSFWAVGNNNYDVNPYIVNYSSTGSLISEISAQGNSYTAVNTNVEMLYDNFFVSTGKFSGASVDFSYDNYSFETTRDTSYNGKFDSYVYTLDQVYEMTDSSTSTNGSVGLTRKNGKGLITINTVSGYKVDTLKIVDKNNNEVEYVDNEDGTYTFILNSDVNVTATYREVIIEKDDTLDDTSFYEVSKTDSGKGKIVVNLESGYQVASIYVLDSYGNEIPVDRGSDGYYFDLIDDAVVTVTYEKIPGNPKTGDFNYLVLIPAIMFCLMCYYFIKKNEAYYEL